VWELLFNMMPVMGEGLRRHKKINKRQVVSKFEEHFVSYNRLEEDREWESPSLVNRSL
jgi:hypothetical protein